MRDFDEFFLKI